MARQRKKHTRADDLDAQARRLAKRLHATAAGASEHLLQMVAKIISEDEEHALHFVVRLYGANLLVAYLRQTPKYLKAVEELERATNNLTRELQEHKDSWAEIEALKAGGLKDREIELKLGLSFGAVARRRYRKKKRLQPRPPT